MLDLARWTHYLLLAAALAVAGCKGGSSSAVISGETAQSDAGAGSQTVGSNTLEPAGVADVKSGWTTLGTRQSASAPAATLAGIEKPGNWRTYETPAIYADSVTYDNIALDMDDGVQISLKVVRPAGANGEAETTPLPTIVTFTPYNKNISDYASLGGSINTYFVERGYNHVLIDVRGTGRSGGEWDPFSEREQQDYPAVLDWIAGQAWSNGELGLWGISATATTSLLAASHRHPAIRAVFPIVPHGDIYRDVVFVGGQASVAFLPAWMSVVTLLATFNPSFYDQPDQYLTAVLEHVQGFDSFLLGRTASVLTGQEESAYDNRYWAAKAPLEISKGLMAPTFIVGGLFDIFQRSEPLNYEALKQHTQAKLLIGPWHHLEAAVGEGLPLNGVPPLDQIAMMWFDHYLKGVDNGAQNLPDVTQWVWGHERFETAGDWPHPEAGARRLFLQGGGGLSEESPDRAAASSQIIQQPLNGVCSQSSLQISLGITGYAPLPCWYEDNLVQTLEATFDTPVLEQDMYINGPLQADVWISSTALDAGVVVRVSDLQPDGTARALTSGLQTASLRAVDASRSRFLDGEMIQPWHPFTESSVQAMASGDIVKVPVEIFPTSALIKKGHRLRISVGASNFPFAAMPAPSLIQSAAGVMSIYHDAERPSSIVLPLVPATVLERRP